jgi:putative transcriptional regulator
MRAFGLTPPDAKDAEIDLHWGGPVEGNHVLLLHSDEYKAASTVTVAPGVALSLPKEALDDIAAGKGPQRLLLAVGYSGWSPGQLERELDMKSWAVIGSGPDLLFDADAAAKWRRAWALRSQEL